jgi:hypothetical protein
MSRLAGMGEDQRAEMGRASAAIAERWEPSRFGAGLLAAVDMGKRQHARRIGGLQLSLPPGRASAAMAETSSGAS